MLKRYLFVVTFIFFFQTIYASPDVSLNQILRSTTNFFDKLKLNYEFHSPTSELYRSIDNEINEYVSKVKKSTNLSRGKRHLDLDKDIKILNGFERVSGPDLRDAIDLTFFVYESGGEMHWYAAGLNSSGISLFQYKNSKFSGVGNFNLKNGTRIICHSSEFATLLVVQRSIGDTLVIRFTEEDFLKRVQTVLTPNATDTALWRGFKDVYFAVATSYDIKFFTWLGRHFDQITTLNIGATRLVPFPTDGSMLVAIDPSRASVIKFLLSCDEFVVVQRLFGAVDATTFHLKREHHEEYFLALAGQRSTVIYKQSRRRFVQFQEISAANDIHSMYNDHGTILLFLIKNRIMSVYQYDGWKFVESGFREFGISDVRTITLENDDYLVVRLLKDSRLRNVSFTERNNVASILNSTIESSRQNCIDSSTECEVSVDNLPIEEHVGKVDSTKVTLGPKERHFADDEFDEKTTLWSFRKITWRRKESLLNLRERTRIWCQDSLERIGVPATVPQLKSPLRIERGYVQTLCAREVNGQSAEKFVKLNDRWKVIVSEARDQEETLKRYISTVNPALKNLQARNLRVNCTTSCRAEKVKTPIEEDFLERLRRIDNIQQNLDFRNVTISFAKNLPCPYPAPKFHNVTVNGRINEINFLEFVNDVMKIKGDQELTGAYRFSELHAVNAKIPLNVAFNFTRRDIAAKNVEVEELSVTSGGILLPLNSDRASMMSGSLTVSEARIKGLVDMSGGNIRGVGGDALSQTIHFIETLDLTGNISLRNVTIVRNLEIEDFTRSVGRSFNDIISRAVPLNSDNVPVHLKFRHDKVSWNNMTLHNFPYKWLTKKHSGHIVITGNKHATRPNITLGKVAYDNLPTPRLPARLCSVAAISDNIWESNLVIDRGSAKSVKAMNIFDQSELSEVHFDSATSFDDVPWALKNLTGRVNVKEANIVDVTGMDYQGLQKSLARWVEPGRLKGPWQFKDLKVNQLIIPSSFKIPLPLEVRNVESKANFYVDTLNNTDLENFITNRAKIDDTLSFMNVTFAGGLVANEIIASETSFSLQKNLFSGYLGSKEILGTLESEEIIVSNFLRVPSFEDRINIFANGNVLFMNGPKITKINDKNLELLHDEIWMTDRATKISTEFIEFKSVTFESNLTLLKSFDTPNLGPWETLENRLLSKTRPQAIKFDASFNSIAAPNIIASAKSRLLSNVSYLRDLGENSLKSNDLQQVIIDKWHFDELIVTGNFDFRDRINGMNLSTDVVRNDVEENVIIGKKIVRDLTARNVDGLKFSAFARNALRRNNGNKTVVVKGWKTFRTVEMQDLRINGTIMGRRIENSLLKSRGQNLQGTKVFQGSVTSPAIITDGLVNNENLAYFVEWQLKKRAPIQTIKTPIKLANNMTISGNITIDGLYQGVELKNFKNVNDGLQSMAKRISELLNFAEGIKIVLENRAVYWDKLELLENNSTSLISDPTKNEVLFLDGLGYCEIIETFLWCNDREFLESLPTATRESRVVQARVINLSGSKLVASVTTDPGGGVFIFRYNPDEKQFYKTADLRVAGIIEGSITRTMNSLWFSLRLWDHMMILRYDEVWLDFHEWILPGNGPFLMSSTPTDELLIFRSDGVWKLGGLAGPRHIFRAALNGQIDTFSFLPIYDSLPDYYVQLTDKNATSPLKSRYIGN